MEEKRHPAAAGQPAQKAKEPAPPPRDRRAPRIAAGPNGDRQSARQLKRRTFYGDNSDDAEEEEAEAEEEAVVAEEEADDAMVVEATVEAAEDAEEAAVTCVEPMIETFSATAVVAEDVDTEPGAVVLGQVDAEPFAGPYSTTLKSSEGGPAVKTGAAAGNGAHANGFPIVTLKFNGAVTLPACYAMAGAPTIAPTLPA